MKTIKPICFLFAFLVLFNYGFAQTQNFKTGDKAPSFKGQTHDGKTFSLADEAKKGPIVIVFYRGYWCPYCNKELKALSDSLAMLTAKGATVVAITPETEESVNKTVEKTKAGFTIISDTSYKILKAYGVDYTVDDNTVQRYKGFGVDFAKVNGNDKNILPVPAVYIIDRNGKFKYIWFDKDFRKRPSVKELLENL